MKSKTDFENGQKRAKIFFIGFFLYIPIFFLLNCTSSSPSSPVSQEKSHTVAYSVTGSVTNLTIGYIDANGAQQISGQRAPWIISFTKTTPFAIGLNVTDMNLITLNAMTVTITIDGATYKSATGTGQVDLGTAIIDKNY